MEKIAAGVYIEKSYPGVIIGAVPLGEAVLLIDAPLRPDDGRSWLATLRGIKGGADRMVVYLDSHIDRTLGGRVLEATIFAHEKVMLEFENRSSIFKAQALETGTEWENCTGLSGIRWMAPHVAFSQKANLEVKDTEIILEHHPGPEAGAIWVALPEEGVVFIGDLVSLSQPPYLSQANLPAWEESLELLSKEYKNYTIVSSRDGVVSERDIREMKKFISNLHKQLERMARRNNNPKSIEKIVDKLLSQFNFEPRYRNQYHQRLQHGLLQCYSSKYLNLKNQ
jgi:glyoxylase-like metal-dependent hydrolase (beta-lactamase superfamily II)